MCVSSVLLQGPTNKYSICCKFGPALVLYFLVRRSEAGIYIIGVRPTDETDDRQHFTKMWIISFWIFPIISAFMWLGTHLAHTVEDAC